MLFWPQPEVVSALHDQEKQERLCKEHIILLLWLAHYLIARAISSCPEFLFSCQINMPEPAIFS